MATQDIELELGRLNITAPSTAQKAPYNLSTAPVEILINIFLHLDFKDLKALSRTCQVFRAVLKNPDFDAPLFRQGYKPEKIALAEHQIRTLNLPQDKMVAYDLNGGGFVEPIYFPIRLHPALRKSAGGGLADKVFRFPLSPADWEWCKDDMATQPTLQALIVCSRYGTLGCRLENECGVTVGQVTEHLKSRLWRVSDRYVGLCKPRLLDEHESDIYWQFQRHQETNLSLNPARLCVWLSVQYMFVNLTDWSM